MIYCPNNHLYAGNDMNGDDHERRISTVEAIVQANTTNILTVLHEIKGSIAVSNEQRVGMISQLAVIDCKQDAMKIYQEKCDAERKQMGIEIADVKNYQTNQRRNVAGISIMIGLLMQSGGELIKKIGNILT